MFPIKKIWLSAAEMSGKEILYIHNAFNKKQVSAHGDNIIRFEQNLASYLSVPHVTCLSSGTAAIHLALIILDVKPGDEIICSSMTFCASANPIKYVGAEPVFVDSEPSTWNMDPILLKKAISSRLTSGKKPKAIIAVHLYGMPSRMDQIMEIAKQFDIPVIEDAAQALGSTLNGQQCGSFGDIGILSFNGNKIITTSGGGALLSANKTITDKALFLATQAREDAPHYQHSEIGFNYRMSNISAGIGRGQVEVLPQRIEKRRDNFFFYKNVLQGLEGISFLEESDSTFFSNHWLTTILIDPEKTGGITRVDVQQALASKNIETKPLYKAMHLQPVFQSNISFLNGVSEELFRLGLCLPSSTLIKDEEREFVANEIIKTIHHV